MIYRFKNYNSIYFRVTKVASTSLLMAFRKIDDLEDISQVYETDTSQHFKFTFVRNPFDRIASCYRHIIQRVGIGSVFLRENGFYHNMPFEEFIERIGNQNIEDMDKHWKPQYTFIPEKPDFMGRFENLNEDFKRVCNLIGLPNIEISWANKTDKTDYSIFTKKTQEIIKRVYKRDFEDLGYKDTILEK